MGRAIVLLVPAEHPVAFRDADDPLDAGQRLHLFNRDRRGIADQVNLSQRLFRALLAVNAHPNIGQMRKPAHQLLISLAFRLDIRS
jgi:hypothetical protein